MAKKQTQATGGGDGRALMAMSHAFFSSQILFTGVELGVFEALALKPAAPAELARRLRLNARGADALLHALAALGLLRKRGGRFSPSEIALQHLVPGRPGYMGNIIRHSSNLQASWAQLPEVVRTGKPAKRPYESGTRAARQATRNFILGMADLAGPMAREMVDRLDLRGVRRVLDVGGGPGTYLFAVLRKVPGATGDVFDLPPVIPIMREQAAAHGLADRVGAVAGDFIDDDLGRGYDLVIMSNVLHSNSPAECRLMLRKGYKALNPGGRIVVSEFTLNEDRTGPPAGAFFSVNMLVNTPGGSAYTSAEISQWLRAAGFVVEKPFPLMDRSTVVVGVKRKKR